MNCVHVLVLIAPLVAGHGRLIEPPSRASAWRYGFDTPVNYQDNEMWCGGFQNQQDEGGKCGVCGDPYQGPRPHEAGGKYATGTIVRSYVEGQQISVKVDLTANHKGWIEFRLCPVNDPDVKATQDCLDRYLLPMAEGLGTRFQVSSYMKIIDFRLVLPEDLVCTQCMLQWKYNAGNSWNTDPVTGESCVGCGPQEQFYGCADISIGGEEAAPNPSPQPSTAKPPTENPPINTSTTIVIPSQTPPDGVCKGAGAWEGDVTMDEWCVVNCAAGHCPPSHCTCTTKVRQNNVGGYAANNANKNHRIIDFTLMIALCAVLRLTVS